MLGIRKQFHLLRSLTLSLVFVSIVLLPTSVWPDQGYYVLAYKRVMFVNAQNGDREVTSGVILRGGGMLAIDPVTKNTYIPDQDDHSIWTRDGLTGTFRLLSGPGIGDGPEFSSSLYDICHDDNKVIVAAGPPSGPGGIADSLLVVDTLTGNRSLLSAGNNAAISRGTGPSFQCAFGVVRQPSGAYLVTDCYKDAVIRVDPLTGNRTVLSGDPVANNVGIGPHLEFPLAIAVNTNGDIYVTDNGSSPRLIQVDSTTGNRTVNMAKFPNGDTSPYDWPFSQSIQGMTSLSTAIYLGSSATVNSEVFGGYMFQIDLDTRTGSVISAAGDDDSGWSLNFVHERGDGPAFYKPLDVAPFSDLMLLLSDIHQCALFGVNKETGKRSLLPNARIGSSPLDLTIGRDGGALARLTNDKLLIADIALKSVVSVSEVSGDCEVVSAGDNSDCPIGTGGNFYEPVDVTVEQLESALVLDAYQSYPKIVRVNLSTGNRSIVSSNEYGTGPNFSFLTSLCIAANGDIYVADDGTNSILKIDGASGNRTIVSSGSQGSGTALSKPVKVRFDNISGELIVVDSGPDSIISIDLTSGNRTVLSGSARGTGQALGDPVSVAINEDGDFLVLDASSCGVVSVDRATGNRTVLASDDDGAGPLLGAAWDLVTAPDVAARSGSISVDLQPVSALTAGAQWKVSGGVWSSNETQSSLPVGAYTVSFKEISGWIKPSDVQIEVLGGQVSSIDGTYLPTLVVLPNVCGMTQNNAISTLETAGFTVGTITEEYSAVVAAGCIITQTPAAFSEVPSGSSIDLVKSLGPAPVAVPDIVGMTESAAQAAIASANLAVGNITEAFSNEIDDGRVISQSPLAETQVSPNSAVSFVVSMGPAPVTVPDITNLTESAARTAVESVNLVVGNVTEAYSEEVDSGRIISQSPAPGTQVPRNSTVNFVLSKGPNGGSSGCAGGTLAPPSFHGNVGDKIVFSLAIGILTVFGLKRWAIS